MRTMLWSAGLAACACLALPPEAATAADATTDLPNFIDPKLHRILVNDALVMLSDVGDITDLVVSPRTAVWCRMPPRERNAFDALQEQTIVPASAYDQRVVDYRARCQLRVIVTGRAGAKTVHAIFNGPPAASLPASVRYAGVPGWIHGDGPVGSLHVEVLPGHLDEAAFRAAAMRLAAE